MCVCVCVCVCAARWFTWEGKWVHKCQRAFIAEGGESCFTHSKGEICSTVKEILISASTSPFSAWKVQEAKEGGGRGKGEGGGRGQGARVNLMYKIEARVLIRCSHITAPSTLVTTIGSNGYARGIYHKQARSLLISLMPANHRPLFLLVSAVKTVSLGNTDTNPIAYGQRISSNPKATRVLARVVSRLRS